MDRREFLNILAIASAAGLPISSREALAAAGGRQRMTRSVEVALLSGRPLSWWHAAGERADPPLEGMVALLEVPREILYDRINRRVEAMMAGGLVEEVERLLAAGYGPGDPGMTGAGYREVAEHLQGAATLEETTEKIQRSHRRYARRQDTWFRHQLPPGTLAVDGRAPLEEQRRVIVEEWHRRTRAHG